MRILSSALRALPLALALSAAACGGASAVSPTAPSSVGGTTAPAGGAPTTAGATISGRVTASSTSTARTAPAEPSTPGAARLAATTADPITVTVVGTNNTTTAGPNGEFTLTGVPSGSVQLQFQSRGAIALITISGIQPSDRIEIAVELRGSTAAVQSENRRRSESNGVDVNGRVTAVGTNSLQVGTTLVTVTPTTVIRHGSRQLTLASIAIGDHVQVKGTRTADGVTASEIKVEPASSRRDDDDEDDEDEEEDDEDDEDDDEDDKKENKGKSGKESELKGSVASLGTGTCPAISFVIKGTTVTTSATTKFDDVTCSAIKVGMSLEVKGTLTGTTMAASKVERD